MEKKYLAVLIHEYDKLAFEYAGPFDSDDQAYTFVREKGKKLRPDYRWIVQQFTEEL